MHRVPLPWVLLVSLALVCTLVVWTGWIIAKAVNQSLNERMPQLTSTAHGSAILPRERQDRINRVMSTNTTFHRPDRKSQNRIAPMCLSAQGHYINAFHQVAGTWAANNVPAPSEERCRVRCERSPQCAGYQFTEEWCKHIPSGAEKVSEAGSSNFRGYIGGIAPCKKISQS